MANQKVIEATKRLHHEGPVPVETIKNMYRAGWDIETVSNREFLGLCESCDKLILDNTPHYEDVEGILTCKKCGPE